MTCPKCDKDKVKPGNWLVNYYKCLACGEVYHAKGLGL